MHRSQGFDDANNTNKNNKSLINKHNKDPKSCEFQTLNKLLCSILDFRVYHNKDPKELRISDNA